VGVDGVDGWRMGVVRRTGTLGGAIVPGTCEGAASDGRPGDEANACVLTIGDL
jgi:hypothetical protein